MQYRSQQLTHLWFIEKANDRQIRSSYSLLYEYIDACVPSHGNGRVLDIR